MCVCESFGGLTAMECVKVSEVTLTYMDVEGLCSVFAHF